MTETNNSEWYVAIEEMGNRYHSVIIPNKGYEDLIKSYAERTNNLGISKLVASLIRVPKNTFYRLIGHGGGNYNPEKDLLGILVKRLNNGEKINAQEELDRLWES